MNYISIKLLKIKHHSSQAEYNGLNIHCPAHMVGWASLVAQTVKRLSTMSETRVQSLGREDPLEKEMAIHSSSIA